MAPSSRTSQKNRPSREDADSDETRGDRKVETKKIAIVIFHCNDDDKLQREASERFAAGYIQCMHEVHTFVSGCPGIDSTIAAELLNHLLESMPLNEGSFQDLIADVLSDSSISQWTSSDGKSQTPEPSPGALNLPSPTSPLLSPSSSEEICSDLEDTETEQSHISLDGLDRSRTPNVPSSSLSKSVWRPW
ncbi:hypothetical protein JD844_007244 [Phrynosoma platyrhinos]|uniref:Orange domain-containing protein n=1 Tax=Phrynosoma platyrhinos TaxID=52577 RepID=A0ABQ7T2P7_PHRPL|nr:hypothetical protein JD844_007244 [Phrynosoma platyrhinos]